MLRAMAERLVYASIPVNVNSLNCIVTGVQGVRGVQGSFRDRSRTRRRPRPRIGDAGRVQYIG